MARLVAITLVGLIASCSGNSHFASPVSQDRGETNIVQDCEQMQDRVKALYESAAISEGVALNRRAEFVSANLHMVLTDCRRKPGMRYACLRRARDVTELESQCLELLDDQGTTEGIRFGG